jgi:hypothetical protein
VRWRSAPFSGEQIKKKVAKLRTSSTPGLNGISARLLQETCEEMAPVLTIIFNISMEEELYQRNGGPPTYTYI